MSLLVLPPWLCRMRVPWKLRRFLWIWRLGWTDVYGLWNPSKERHFLMLGKGLEVSWWIFPELKCEFGTPILLSLIAQIQTLSLILSIVIEYQLKPPSLSGPRLWTPQIIPLNPPPTCHCIPVPYSSRYHSGHTRKPGRLPSEHLLPTSVSQHHGSFSVNKLAEQAIKTSNMATIL